MEIIQYSTIAYTWIPEHDVHIGLGIYLYFFNLTLGIMLAYFTYNLPSDEQEKKKLEIEF